MRFTLASMVLAMLAFASAPTHAISASSTLTRLSARLAAAESALAQLSSQSQTESEAGNAPNTLGTYTFNSGSLIDSKGGSKITFVPTGAFTLSLLSNAARGSGVLMRAASATQSSSYASVPKGLGQSAFSVSLLVNWGGYLNPSASEGTFFSSGANDQVKLSVDASGKVSATVGTAKVTDVNAIEPGVWSQYMVTWGSTYTPNQLNLYRDGQPVGSATGAALSGATTSIRLLNNGAGNGGVVGQVDQFNTFAEELVDEGPGLQALDDSSSAVGQSPAGQSGTSGAAKWYGHTINTKVAFANRVQQTATGDVTVSGTVWDIDLRAGNQIWVLMFGVTGPSVYDVDVGVEGLASASWDQSTSVLSLRLSAPITKNTQFSFTIPSSKIALTNPTQAKLCVANDPRWSLSVFNLALDQTPPKTVQQGLRWQGITQTPITINDNPAL